MSTLNNSSISITAENEVNYISALIDILIICISALKLKDLRLVIFHFNISSPYNFNSPLIILVLYIIGGYCIYNLLFMITGKTTITISDNILTVTEKIVGISKTNNYHIDQIQNLRFEMVNSSMGWGFQGFYFSDHTFKTLVFNYNNTKVTLGKGLRDLNVEELKNAIK